MLQQRHVLRPLEPLARERSQPVHLATVPVLHRTRTPDLEPLLEIVEIDAPEQPIFVQLVKHRTSDLVRLQGDPVDRRQLVLGLHLPLDGHRAVRRLHQAGGRRWDGGVRHARRRRWWARGRRGSRGGGRRRQGRQGR